MTDSDILKSNVVKEIEKYLGSYTFKEVKENNKRIYRNPSNGKNAVIVSLELSGGMEVVFWVAKGGSIVRVELNQDVIESANASESEAQITEQELAREIKKKIIADQKAEFKVKIDKRKMGQLIDELQSGKDDGIEAGRLSVLKQDLVKGSGKFIVVASNGEFYGQDGFTDKQSEIVTFDTVEEAKSVIVNNEKVVRI